MKNVANKLRDELKTARELIDEQRQALYRTREELSKAKGDAERWHSLHERQLKDNKKVVDELRHQERLVKTLVDTLADKYHPLPTKFTLNVDYRIAKDEPESPF